MQGDEKRIDLMSVDDVRRLRGGERIFVSAGSEGFAVGDRVGIGEHWRAGTGFINAMVRAETGRDLIIYTADMDPIESMDDAHEYGREPPEELPAWAVRTFAIVEAVDESLNRVELASA